MKLKNLTLSILLLLSIQSLNATEVLCKKDGKLYNALNVNDQSTCFEALYWGGVCYRGNASEAMEIMKKSFPIKTGFQSVSDPILNKNLISYSATDHIYNVKEAMTIASCGNKFIR